MDSILPVEILLVEDNPGDVRLVREALAQSKIVNNLVVIADGEEALKLLAGPDSSRSRPGLIILDLNLPGLDGREVLRQIKSDPALKTIPVVVMTSSRAEEDVLRSYELHANCYVAKPLDLASFAKVVQSVETFWFSIVTLPGRTE